MTNLLFITFAFITLAGAALVVVNKNAVHAAMGLFSSLIGLAGLFVLLEAGFLAVLLLFIYAGAVVALFLFIIMLLDTTPGAQKPFKKMTVAASLLGAGLLVVGIVSLSERAVLPHAPASVTVPTLKNFAEQLFTTYLLPVQVVGFMLLIAMLGVIVLSKKFDVPEDAK